MRRFLLPLCCALFIVPMHAHAYRVPERETWRAFSLSLLNESRAEAGLPPVGLDAELTEVAQAHAEDTATHYDDASAASRRATYLIHESSDKRTLRERVLNRQILGGAAFGENVGFTYSSRFGTALEGTIEDSLRDMHDRMMQEVPPDDGHKKTILGDYTHVGIGLEFHRIAGTGANTLFLVQDFGRFTDSRAVVIPEFRPPESTVTQRKPALAPAARAASASIERRLGRIRRRTEAVKRKRTPTRGMLRIPLLRVRDIEERGAVRVRRR